jgi:hypothetical protein
MADPLKLPKSYADRLQPMVRPTGIVSDQDVAQIYADRAMVARKQLEDRVAAIDKQRIIQLAEFDKDISENLQPDLLKYPEVQHNIRRDRAMIEAESMRQKGLLQTSGMQAGQAERYMKALDQTIKDRLGDQLQPWEATKQYETSEKNWEDVKAKRNPIEQLNTQVREAQALYNQGADLEIKGLKREADVKYQQATEFMKTNMLKTLNSIISSDAVNLSEALVRYKQLFTGPELATMQRAPLFGATSLVDKYMSLPLEERKTAMFENLKKVFEGDPGSFLMNATRAANGYASTHNQQITDLVENTTSKRTAKNWGAVPIPMLDESVAGKLYKEKAMNELNAPLSGGGMQPSQQIQTAPQMQAPPQQQAPQPRRMRLISIE